MRIHGVLLFVVLGTGLACGGHPEPAAVTEGRAASLLAASSVRAQDEGPSLPVTPAACTLGKGEPGAICTQGELPELLGEVDAAIDELIKKQPKLFDLDRVVGQNGYLVLDAQAFYLGVAAILQAKGLCAEWDYEALQVKNSQARSERYDLILANGHIRRGLGSYRAACRPAAFPLDPSQVIYRVRVAFYSIRCEDGRTPPRNGEGLLPVDCTGFVTATPKKQDDSDVDKRIHGPEIAWTLEQEGEKITLYDFPKVDFNKELRGRDPGRFRLCATVQTRVGCLDGEVID